MTPAGAHEGLNERLRLRLANPFPRLVAVVRTAGARALTRDGRSWQIEFLAHPPCGLWSREDHQEHLQYVRFGLWSERTDLCRA